MGRYIIYLLLLLCVSSCTKNELSFSGKFSDAPTQPLRVIYRAASGTGAFLVDNPVPLAQGEFTMKVATRYPTVIWVIASDGTTLMPIYAEKGDELVLSGKYSEPYAWRVEGNDVMERYTVWAKENVATLKSGEPERVNAAIAREVKANPGSRASAFILFTRFARVGNEKEFNDLKKLLTLDEDDIKEMESAALLPPVTGVATGSAKFAGLTLPTPKDSLCHLKPSANTKTLLYFWRDSFGNTHSGMQKLMKELSKDSTVRMANIYMDTDTAAWHRQLSADTTLRTSCPLWALGAEANASVATLGVPSVPFIIVADGKGVQLYRGTDPDKARLMINKR